MEALLHAEIASAGAEVDRWRRLGVAILPGKSRAKDSWPKAWPSLPHPETWDLSARRARCGPLNLALRLGPTEDGSRILGHLDFDGIGSVDADAALSWAHELFPAAPLLKTSAGRWRMYFWSSREIPDGIVRELGAEIAANPGRLSIVHGVHPSGSAYEWIAPPTDDLPLVDVDALGILIEAKAASRASQSRAHAGHAAAKSASPEQVRDFEMLMQQVGVVRRYDDEFRRCPWHTETEASLHVTWSAAVFCCFGCGEQGGVRRLRELVGGPLPPSCNPSSDQREGITRGLQLGGKGVRAERDRLADALSLLGEHDRADLMRECREATLDAADADIEAFACPNGDATPVKSRIHSCDDAQCPTCMPWRLGSDWNHHWSRDGREAPHHLTLARLRAIQLSVGLDDGRYPQRVRAQFREWQRRRGLRGGIYGLTLSREGDCWRAELLVTVGDGDVERITDGRAFTVEIVGHDFDSRDILRAFQHAYLNEATAWRDVGELAAFRVLITGRRKFQGFGNEFGTKATGDEVEEKAMTEQEEQPLHRMAGGSGKASKQRPCCPRCGERLKRVGPFDRDRMEMRIAEDGVTEWCWRRKETIHGSL